MKLIFIVFLALILNSCAGMWPDMAKTIDDIATDGVIQVQVDKEAFQKQTNTRINIEIINEHDSKN